MVCPEIVGAVDTESLHELIVWLSGWGSRYERAVRNEKSTQKQTQVVVRQVSSRSQRPLETEPRGLFSDGQSPEVNGLSALYTKQ